MVLTPHRASRRATSGHPKQQKPFWRCDALIADTALELVFVLEFSAHNADISRIMIERAAHESEVEKLLRQFPVVAILGSRQVGKTTLAQQIAKRSERNVEFFDLERAADRAILENPLLTLEKLRGLIVIDEVQRQPALFDALRVLADRPRRPARFLLLGSASPQLSSQSETLAGRIAYHSLRGFDLSEIKTPQAERLWIRGGYPRSFLARSHADSARWRSEFISTFLERDLPQLGVTISTTTMRRFWTMLAHYHGQTWNSSEFASSFGVADTTVRRYLDILSSAFVVQQLQPWHENINKRQVKSPKVYLTDSGILHSLLDLATQREVESHPKLGASWEGFVIGEVRRAMRARDNQSFFWATHAGAELDLLIVQGTRRTGFEVKRTDAPRRTKSMHIALNDLGLQRLHVIHAGKESFPLDDRIQATAACRILTDLKPGKRR